MPAVHPSSHTPAPDGHPSSSDGLAKNLNRLALGLDRLAAAKPSDFTNPATRKIIDQEVHKMAKAAAEILGDPKIASTLTTMAKTILQDKDLEQHIQALKNIVDDLFQKFQIPRNANTEDNVAHWIQELTAAEKTTDLPSVMTLSSTTAPTTSPSTAHGANIGTPTLGAPAQLEPMKGSSISKNDPLFNKLMPSGQHLWSRGTLSFGFPDGVKKGFSFLAANGKLDNDYAPESSPKLSSFTFWSNTRRNLANLFLTQDTDVIFLNGETSPAKLNDLMNLEVNGKKLSTMYDYKIDDFRGAVLYKKDKFVGQLVAGGVNAIKNGMDERRSTAGSQVQEYVSLFSLKFKDEQSLSPNQQHQINAFVGKGPHNNIDNDNFVSDYLQPAMQRYAGNNPMIATIASGDWNNTVSETRGQVQNLSYPLVKNGFGSNAKDLQIAAMSSHPPKDTAANGEDLKQKLAGTRPNDQILFLQRTGQTATLPDQKILYDESLFHYGVEPESLPPTPITPIPTPTPTASSPQKLFMELASTTLIGLATLRDGVQQNQIPQDRLKSAMEEMINRFNAHVTPDMLQKVGDQNLINVANAISGLQNSLLVQDTIAAQDISNQINPLFGTINSRLGQQPYEVSWPDLQKNNIVPPTERSPLDIANDAMKPQPAGQIENQDQFLDLANVTLDSIAILRDAYVKNKTITESTFNQALRQILTIYSNHIGPISLTGDVNTVLTQLNNIASNPTSLNASNLDTTLNPLFGIIDATIGQRPSEISWQNLKKIVTTDPFPIEIALKASSTTPVPPVIPPTPVTPPVNPPVTPVINKITIPSAATNPSGENTARRQLVQLTEATLDALSALSDSVYITKKVTPTEGQQILAQMKQLFASIIDPSSFGHILVGQESVKKLAMDLPNFTLDNIRDKKFFIKSYYNSIGFYRDIYNAGADTNWKALQNANIVSKNAASPLDLLRNVRDRIQPTP